MLYETVTVLSAGPLSLTGPSLFGINRLWPENCMELRGG